MADIEELLRVDSDDNSITRSYRSPSPVSGQGGGKSGPPSLGLSIAVDGQGGAFDRTTFLRQTSPCPDPPNPSSHDSQLTALQSQVATLTASVAAQDSRLERMVRLNGEQMDLLLRLVSAKNGAPARVPPLATEPDTGLSLSSAAVAPPPLLPATGDVVAADEAITVAPVMGLAPAPAGVDLADTALVDPASPPLTQGTQSWRRCFPMLLWMARTFPLVWRLLFPDTGPLPSIRQTMMPWGRCHCRAIYQLCRLRW